MSTSNTVRLNLNQMEDRTVMSAVGPLDFSGGPADAVGYKYILEDMIISGAHGSAAGNHVLYQDVFIPAAAADRTGVRVVVPVPDAALDVAGHVPEAAIKKAVLFVRKSGGDSGDYRTEVGVVTFGTPGESAEAADRAVWDLVASKKS